MATKKVSALSALTSPDGAEELLINDGGTSKKVTITNANKKLFSFLDANGNYIQMQKGEDIASASPTVIDTDGDYFICTGTTGFTTFTVAADRHFFLEFAAILTMTHGAGTLDLPGGANITTAASDVGEFYSTAANVVTCVNYTKADGTPIAVNIVDDTSPQLGGDLDCNGSQIQWSQGADVASTGALPVLTDGNYFDVTGTTTITSINTTGGVGTLIKLHFDGILTLTHHATDLILPGGANITTAAGDEAEFIEYASGDYRCTNYSKASGEAVVGASGVTLGFFEHTHTISSDLTISTDYNALSAGPITVASGYSVTIPSGSTWVIA